ncbi:MAG: hypothetical protein HY720_18165 [Planctomycetes bacterium]|nr:hypothetical protein [Planctomycetota bacterium]
MKRLIAVLVLGFAVLPWVGAQETETARIRSGTFVIGSFGQFGFDFETGRVVDPGEADLVIGNSAGGATGLAIEGKNGARIAQPFGEADFDRELLEDVAAREAWKRQRFQGLEEAPDAGYEANVDTDDRMPGTEILVVRPGGGVAKLLLRRDHDDEKLERSLLTRDEADDFHIPVVFDYLYQPDPKGKLTGEIADGVEPAWFEPLLRDARAPRAGDPVTGKDIPLSEARFDPRVGVTARSSNGRVSVSQESAVLWEGEGRSVATRVENVEGRKVLVIEVDGRVVARIPEKN